MLSLTRDALWNQQLFFNGGAFKSHYNSCSDHQCFASTWMNTRVTYSVTSPDPALTSCAFLRSYLQTNGSKDFQRCTIDMLEDAEVVSTMLIPGVCVRAPAYK